MKFIILFTVLPASLKASPKFSRKSFKGNATMSFRLTKFLLIEISKSLPNDTIPLNTALTTPNNLPNCFVIVRIAAPNPAPINLPTFGASPPRLFIESKTLFNAVFRPPSPIEDINCEMLSCKFENLPPNVALWSARPDAN